MQRSALTLSENSRTPARKSSSSSKEKIFSKTPCSVVNNGCGLALRTSKTPAKTPGKTPGKNTRITPSRNTNAVGKTPGGGDRFIPNRAGTQFTELGHYMLMSQSQSQSESTLNESRSAPSSPNRTEYQRTMRENLNGGVSAPSLSMSDLSITQNGEQNYRILAYQKGKAPLAPQGAANANRVLYTAPRVAPASSCKKTMRHIPSSAERILDAPEIMDDYYLNLIDWSSRNVLAVALSGQLFLWSADSGDIQMLTELESSSDYICSVSWVKDGNYLSVGLSTGAVQLWDVDQTRLMRTLESHTQRTSALCWNSHILTSGSRDGTIHHHDVRVREHLIGSFDGHTQEVCGLKWSPDGRYLASGSNDNFLMIWPNEYARGTAPLHRLTEHQSAVKALAWCPWQHNILASGGGTADRQIRIWNLATGSCLSSTDAQSQVMALLWSSEYKELISAHGYPSNQLAVWKYPQMHKICELSGHSSRVLNMCMSPCGEFVISAAGDESLRLWHCFAVDAEEKKKRNRQQKQAKKSSTGLTLTGGIR